jgi:hypothetical protein
VPHWHWQAAAIQVERGERHAIRRRDVSRDTALSRETRSSARETRSRDHPRCFSTPFSRERPESWVLYFEVEKYLTLQGYDVTTLVPRTRAGVCGGDIYSILLGIPTCGPSRKNFVTPAQEGSSLAFGGGHFFNCAIARTFGPSRRPLKQRRAKIKFAFHRTRRGLGPGGTSWQHPRAHGGRVLVPQEPASPGST